ncbi:hypothetical protein ACFFJY_04765 [Fictibacillus aquaticus]|uniref:Uncharacterized protein n=1 Tax=Fictibacillus aquaticus TaxID=2021314 RepID=A0A235F4M6_9BACL|nr:hypothetical protein [Fictibacillus aquaticus]OYD56182.1 hypothetical protein CGZ90_18870 [Fictibacillus aquaticus]
MNRTTDEKIKIRNHWFKIILISLFAMVLMFKIAVTKFTFHFADLLSFILAIFAISISAMFYTKVNEALRAAAIGTKDLLPSKKKKNEPEAAFTEEDDVEEEEAEGYADLPDNERNQLERRMLDLNEQLKRVRQVQNEIVERLSMSEELSEDDRRDYLDYLLEKEKEAVLAEKELEAIEISLQPQLLNEEGLAEDEWDEDGDRIPDTARNTKEIVQLLGKEFVLNASFEQLNHKMREIQPNISPEAAEYLKENDLVDSFFNVSRKGLKEFRKIARKFSYNDGMKLLSKVVQRSK